MAKEAADDYQSTLSELTGNNKTQINLLTILAEDYSAYASEIVRVIEETIYKAAPPLKHVLLYVLDSIVKNVTKAEKSDSPDYRFLFAKNLIKLFVHVFQESDEKARASLYKLRITWKDIFPKAKLYGIDTQVNAIDPKWPIISPQGTFLSASTSNQNGTKPQSNGTAEPKAETSPASLGQMVHVNPKFFNANKTPEKPPTSSVSVVTTTVVPTTITVTSESSSKPLKSALKKPAAPKMQQTTTVTAHPNGTRVVKMNSPKPKVNGGEKKDGVIPKNVLLDKEIKPEPVDEPVETAPVTVTTPEKQRKRKKDKSEENRKEKERGEKSKKSKEPKTEKAIKEEMPDAFFPTSKSSPDSTTSQESTKRPAEDDKHSEVEEKRIRRASPDSTATATINRHNGPSQHSSAKANGGNTRGGYRGAPRGQPFRHDNNGGRSSPPNRFVPDSPPVRFFNAEPHRPIKREPLSHTMPPPHSSVQPTVAPGSHAFVSPAVSQPSAFPPSVPSFGPRPPVSGPPPAGMIPPFGGMPGGYHPSMPPNMMPPASVTPVIQDQSPKFVGVPANNRIFVDGKAYEVFYLDGVPVIERNGVPHRISFSGPPHDVIIDDIRYTLNFGESRPVVIDGETHILRFGAPSKELFMGDFAFKGAFGGPPIIATINGRRHEIRLCGAPPEVKIEQDPCYELMRHMQTVRQTGGPTTAPPIKEESSKAEAIDVSGLLKRLQKSGLLQQIQAKANESADSAPATSRPQKSAPSTSSRRENNASPPIPSTYRIETLERRPAPLSSLADFSMRLLLIRYDSIIDELHKPRIACPHCGIGFRELYGEAYQQHTDWHVQENLRFRERGLGRSRPWFRKEEEWLAHSETEEVNKASTAGKDNKSAVVGTDGTGDAHSNETEMKECQVCNEKFEEYWDEDDEVWKLRDCTIERGKAFHRQCLPDASYWEEEAGTSSEAPPGNSAVAALETFSADFKPHNSPDSDYDSKSSQMSAYVPLADLKMASQ